MVYHLPSSISVCKSVDQASSLMPFSMSLSKHSNDGHLLHHRARKAPSSPGHSKTPAGCDRSRSAAIDVVILIAVVVACGFLVLPSIEFLFAQSVELFDAIKEVLREEVSEAPMIYGSVGLSICSAVLAAWGVLACTGRRCGNPSCKGLRKAAEFDIQLETEDCVKNSASAAAAEGGLKRGLFELPRDHHRELEAELRKMAPPNGRAVLVFRARCGCSVGRLEVPGPKRIRKIKK